MSAWCIDAEYAGRRLDVFLSEKADITRSRAEKLIRDGQATVDGKPVAKSGTPLKAGQRVELNIPEVKQVELIAQDLPIEVIYQDQDLAVVYKPSGMVVHPAAGNPDGTMVNALMMKLDNLSGIGGEMRPGIVHRIDKDTSGLLLVAKNDRSHLFLSEQIKEHTVQRAYLSIVIGKFRETEGDVHGAIGRHPTDRKKMAIVSDGKEAHTHWRVLEELKGATLIEARLTTGRTHQIRVHMASLGHPVLGDPVYGPKKSPYPVEGGQLLHAFRLGFVHPATGENMLFEVPPEKRFTDWQKKLSMK